MSSRPAAGGGRWVEVDPARIDRWVAGFADRHGPPTTTAQPYGLLLSAPDGATAELHPPPGAPTTPGLDTFVASANAPRRIGLLLARKGAVAVGVADGTDLIVSKVDTRYVQGRTAAGGWSQQRFARRRDNQAKAALADAADLAVRLLLPQAATLTAVVCGGDRRAVDAVLADRRLARLAELRAERLLDVPEPRHAVLVAAVSAARAVRVLVRDPVLP
ncbi:acVLRF1 family peptidyl-tRNA hydrolase [Micromonospora sp. WMMD1082]|uniref:acVLRF1 family peptidyl-tRNA hydrolase n=1 Tax=Micromonospora sp. WMMD1082 TaxID=3016104 RepID=UPI0024161104|nr:acVLRF1 family peptidyl-tRNA hydrolase [Micromonospora sp. WMMD1082]MDG4796714.1 acVLRF1 family peptidyl-tRNA hydrolase [Micromonospora sp. WMMD1082]